MSLPQQVSNALPGLAVGATATATPFWWDWIPPAYQGLSMALGLVILILTIRKLLKENAKLDRDAKREGQ